MPGEGGGGVVVWCMLWLALVRYGVARLDFSTTILQKIGVKRGKSRKLEISRNL